MLRHPARHNHQPYFLWNFQGNNSYRLEVRQQDVVIDQRTTGREPERRSPSPLHPARGMEKMSEAILTGFLRPATESRSGLKRLPSHHLLNPLQAPEWLVLNYDMAKRQQIFSRGR